MVEVFADRQLTLGVQPPRVNAAVRKPDAGRVGRQLVRHVLEQLVVGHAPLPLAHVRLPLPRVQPHAGGDQLAPLLDERDPTDTWK